MKLRKIFYDSSGLPDWLILRCREETGGLLEMLSLIPLTDRKYNPIPLHEFFHELTGTEAGTPDERNEFIVSMWRRLSAQERYLCNKLITGTFRSPVSVSLLADVFTRAFGGDRRTVLIRLRSAWRLETISISQLAAGTTESETRRMPYPFAEHRTLDESLQTIGAPGDWYYYPSHEGTRCQLVRRDGRTTIWSSDGDIFSVRELNEETYLSRDVVLDVLASGSGEKTLLFIHDILEIDGEDIRQLPLVKRRSILTENFGGMEGILQIVPGLRVESWRKLKTAAPVLRDGGASGLILKRRTDAYPHASAMVNWILYKPDPFVCTAVLLYIESDPRGDAGMDPMCTFAVKSGSGLVPFTKTSAGLDERLRDIIMMHAAEHTTERFGPVRSVRAELVFEISFESMTPSARRKSGVTVSGSRVRRYITGMPVTAIDTIESIRGLAASPGTDGNPAAHTAKGKTRRKS